MIVDLEHHLYRLEQVHRGSSPSGRIVERLWDESGNLRSRTYEEACRVDRHLQFMDDATIDMALLSTFPFIDLDQCRKWNDFCAKVVRENPSRFAGFASVPPLGGKQALDELERAVKDLGLKGVHIYTRPGGRTLDDKGLWPFYEKASELGIPIDVHVAGEPPGFEGVHAPYGLYFVMAREFDICAATFRLCLGGALEDFPDLVFIVNHFGGGISAVMERLDLYCGYDASPGLPSFYSGERLVTKPWREYFGKLYFNMAGRGVGMDAVKCALTNISPRRLMFGTDWPHNYEGDAQEVRRYIQEIRRLGLPADDIEAMLGGNAARLFGLQNTSSRDAE